MSFLDPYEWTIEDKSELEAYRERKRRAKQKKKEEQEKEQEKLFNERKEELKKKAELGYFESGKRAQEYYKELGYLPTVVQTGYDSPISSNRFSQKLNAPTSGTLTYTKRKPIAKPEPKQTPKKQAPKKEVKEEPKKKRPDLNKLLPLVFGSLGDIAYLGTAGAMTDRGMTNYQLKELNTVKSYKDILERKKEREKAQEDYKRTLQLMLKQQDFQASENQKNRALQRELANKQGGLASGVNPLQKLAEASEQLGGN